MKMMKKLAMLLTVLCLAVSNVTMLSYAADGSVMFTDPTTAVGESLELMGVVKTTDGTSIEDRTVTMSYDTAMLKFKEGDHVTETAPGQLTYEVKGQKDGDRVEFMMYFDVLKEGTTKLEMISCNAWNTLNDRINCQPGFSTITIEAGEGVPNSPVDVPTDAATVEVDGKTYSFGGDFEEADIPNGYVEATLNYDGADYKVVQNTKNGLYLAYLVDAANAGEFFMYVEENATFAPYAEIAISDATSIVLLSDVERIELPETYVATTVTVNGKEFPAWKDTVKTEFCIVYALNSAGENSLYQYDTVESTYQKFEAPEVMKKDDSFMGRLLEFLQNHLEYVILATGIGFILFIVVIIVLGIKLYNRNAELDELYDEYGIDFDDEEDAGKDAKKNKKADEIKLIRIDDEIEEDVIMEESELGVESLEEDVQAEENEDLEIDVAFFEKVILENEVKEEGENQVSTKDDIKDNYYDEEEDYSDFEIDFIDLND